jgi:hypothetical protein
MMLDISLILFHQKNLLTPTTNIEFDAIDVASTVGVASTNRLYLYNRTNEDVRPDNVIEGYSIGAKENDSIQCLISQGGTPIEYSQELLFQILNLHLNEVTSEKKFVVGRSLQVLIVFLPMSSHSQDHIVLLKVNQFVS